MALAIELISQLMTVLPTFTNYFSDEFIVSSITRSGSTVTVVTTTPHGLVTGKSATIMGARAPVEVISLTRSGNIASGTTATPHDLTEGDSLHNKIYITGANETEYNVDGIEMISAVNRYQFQYFVNGTPATPATGSILLWDGAERGYNGIFTVTVIDTVTFTYQISGTPLDPIGDIIVRANYRLSGGLSLERIEKAYTKHAAGKLYGFICLDDTDASKNREVFSDAIADITNGSAYLQLELQRFYFYVFVPITDSVIGRYERDLIEQIRIPIYKTLLRFKTQNGLESQESFGIALVSHRPSKETPAYYVHEFLFEIQNQILINDTYIKRNDFAFRDIYGEMLHDTFDETIDPMLLAVNLDDIPYEP